LRLPACADPFDQLGSDADRVQLLPGEPLQIRGEDPDALSPPFGADPSSSDGGADQDTAGIVGIGRSSHQAVALQAIDEPRHRRRRHPLGRRQGTDPDRTGVDDDREGCQAGRGDAAGIALRT